ncbi:MAG TPA: CDP-alcohol phosphatidyltransferase family protein [Bacteroidia bacterium]|nr:CDP-alcohol phosphatidyltransferase family protein [Bacteroidia bacterium]
MRFLKHIPNTLTSLNLVCGCLALVQIFSGDLHLAALLVFLAVLFDFFDGFAARLLKAYSPIGKDLDSLADMVSFGLVPGFMMFRLIQFALLANNEKELFWIAVQNNIQHVELENNPQLLGAWSMYLPYLALLIPVFSALRLAKFNNDSRQGDQFIGLPTPANALLIAGLVLNLDHPTTLMMGMNNVYSLVLGCVLMSYLLVAEWPLLALKFKTYTWKENSMRYSLLGLSALLLALFQIRAIPLLILLYILISTVNNIFFKARH